MRLASGCISLQHYYCIVRTSQYALLQSKTNVYVMTHVSAIDEDATKLFLSHLHIWKNVSAIEEDVTEFLILHHHVGLT